MRAALSSRLPDAEILTHAEFRKRSLDYWLFETGAGAALIAGAALGIIVGIVIVAQTLYASTKDHLNEFATLRALGASAGYINKVILMQAVLSALIGYLLGMALSLVVIWASQELDPADRHDAGPRRHAVRADRRHVRARRHVRHLQSDPYRPGRGVQPLTVTPLLEKKTMTHSGITMLEARDITKVYRSGAGDVMPLKGVNVDLMAGELTLLMGPSGSGKTTLLSILGCILSPTSGTLRLAGIPTKGLNAEGMADLRRKHVGFVFQAYNLVPTLTALENVMLALDLRGASLADQPYLAWEALDAVGLSHRAHVSPSKLSGGEKQRVSIARALAGSPSVILADEPTAALDSENGKAVMALLAEVAKDTRRAVLVVTHDHRTLEYGDRMIRIEDGRIASRARRRPTSARGEFDLIEAA